MAEIEIYTDRKGEHRWRLKSGSGIIADSGEGYKTDAGARRGAQNFKDRARKARIVPPKPSSSGGGSSKPAAGRSTSAAKKPTSTKKAKPSARSKGSSSPKRSSGSRKRSS